MDGTEDAGSGTPDALLQAVLAVGSDLDLEQVLQRIVESAVSLADARYGALGVLSDDGESLVRFLTVGIDAPGVARIGAAPSGVGVMGELVRLAHPLRLPDVAERASSQGFPPHHPPMRSFLGVPVLVGSEVLGNLYLTDKRGGDFGQQDEDVVVALAAAAGVAIKNARLHEETRRSAAWRAASEEVLAALLSGAERLDVLELVTRRARELGGAQAALLALPGPHGWEITQESLEEHDAVGALSAVLDEVLDEQQSQPVRVGDRDGVALPVGGVGLLVCLWDAPPAEAQLVDLELYGAQAAVVLELVGRRREAERFAEVEDRDRIARDLHDLVIQRLFATGMLLQSAVRTDADPEEVRQRMDRAVDELDETIRELRSTLYGLQAPAASRPSLRCQVLAEVDAAAEQLGFAPSLRMDGLLDTLATAEIADNLLAVLREALSGVARHAGATRVDVGVRVHGEVYTVQVVDDGAGTAHEAVRSELVDLAARAEDLGGSLRVVSTGAGGTSLVWEVPF